MLIYAYGFCMLLTGQCQIMMTQDASWGDNPKTYCEKMADIQNKNNGLEVMRHMHYECFHREVSVWEH